MDDVLDAQGAGMEDGDNESEAVSGQWSASVHTTDVDDDDDSDMDDDDMAALHGGDEKEEEVEILADDVKVKKKEDYVSRKHMTRYERARVLGTRALQLSLRAPPMVEIGAESDPLRIAMKELQEGVIPIKIRRYLPDGSYEDWSANEMIMDPYIDVCGDKDEAVRGGFHKRG